MRVEAVYELRFFVRDGKRAVPALLARLSDSEEDVRYATLFSLHSFPAEATPHANRILEILRGGPGISTRMRQSAAYLLATSYPLLDEVMQGLTSLSQEKDDGLAQTGRQTLEIYRMRHSVEPTGR